MPSWCTKVLTFAVLYHNTFLEGKAWTFILQCAQSQILVSVLAVNLLAQAQKICFASEEAKKITAVRFSALMVYSWCKIINHVLYGCNQKLQYHFWLLTVASFSRDKKRPGVLAIWCDDKYDIFGCQIELLFERYNLVIVSFFNRQPIAMNCILVKLTLSLTFVVFF